jgi:hypothetical protein
MLHVLPNLSFPLLLRTDAGAKVATMLGSRELRLALHMGTGRQSGVRFPISVCPGRLPKFRSSYYEFVFVPPQNVIPAECLFAEPNKTKDIHPEDSRFTLSLFIKF